MKRILQPLLFCGAVVICSFCLAPFLPRGARDQSLQASSDPRGAAEAHEVGSQPEYAIDRNCHALLVGINHYPGLPPGLDLHYAEQDAIELAKVLVRSYGFAPDNVKVLLGDQATKQKIESALAELTDPHRVQKKDAVLVFFAGHGQAVALSESHGKAGFLIPSDAHVNLANANNPTPYLQDCIQMDLLANRLGMAAARHWLIVADACFGGLLAGQARGGVEQDRDANPELVREYLSRPAQEVFTAGSADQKSYENGRAGQGVFTNKLLEELRAKAANPNKPLLASSLASAVQVDVGNATHAQQTPELNRMNDSRAEFIFITTRPNGKAESVMEHRFGIAHRDEAKGRTSPPSRQPRKNPIDGAEMVYIPPGEFLMGTNLSEADHLLKRYNWPNDLKEYAPRESPAHRVRISEGFWMYRSPVTVAQYRKFCLATGRQMPTLPEYNRKDNHPMVNVDWDDAQAYCSWAGAWLPTEAQWEYAARGKATGVNGKPRHVFVWGDDLPLGHQRVANLCDETAKPGNYAINQFSGYVDGYREVAPVGSFQPNDWGLYDMAGNVWEWCSDWFDEDYYKKSPSTDPNGPTQGPLIAGLSAARVIRGGSWSSDANFLTAAARGRRFPKSGLCIVGFRPVRSEY